MSRLSSAITFLAATTVSFGVMSGVAYGWLRLVAHGRAELGNSVVVYLPVLGLFAVVSVAVGLAVSHYAHRHWAGGPN